MTRSTAILFLCFSLATPSLMAADEKPTVVVSASIVKSDDGHTLRIQAQIREGLHIYSQSQAKPFRAATIIVTDTSEGVGAPSEFTADRDPILTRHPDLEVELSEFEETVTWETPLKISGDLKDATVRGTLYVQACENGRCFEPQTYTFEASIGAGAATQPVVVVDVQGSTSAASNLAFSLDSLNVKTTQSTQSIWGVLPLAFLAGFLLNFMPCVLPVVALKLLSFVQQAQSDRRRIMLMNLSYTGGVLFVMLVLASLAVFAGMGWGEQFSSTGFTITLAAIVFAFGLSFLNVWEIPLPGFVSMADGKAPTEGYTGAFSKGILSTVLATPCSGPFLGAALAWAVTQPSVLTYAVFVTVGLGMASPYVVIGAFPSLIRHLPKPGNWMITFKYVMGFVMLGTVVYLLSFLSVASVVPTVLLLLGISIAVWFAGQTPYTAPRAKQLKAWGIATTIVFATSVTSFGWLEGVMQERFERAAVRFASDRFDSQPNAEVVHGDGIAWQNYSPELLEASIAAGRPVFVDFTADWCLTCKANEAAAVNKEELANTLRDNEVIALRADKTEPNPEADTLLRKLGNSAASIPFYAVFHPENPGQPVVLDGVFTSCKPFVNAVQGQRVAATKSTPTAQSDRQAIADNVPPEETDDTRPTIESAEAIVDKAIPWQDYSPALLESTLASGRPVFVDFTADWCPACKKNHASAIDTKQLRAALRKHHVVALLADKTAENLEADALLKKLGNTDGHIPYYAIIHPGHPNAPIVLDGVQKSSRAFVDAIQHKANEGSSGTGAHR